MSQLEINAILLANTCQELGVPGGFVASPLQELANIAKKLALPQSLVDWYAVASPKGVEIPTIGNSCPLLNPSVLEQGLAGYAYNSLTGVKSDTWNDNWIVIGGEGGYPIIVYSSKISDAKVYCARSSARIWYLDILASDLAGFLSGITKYVKLYLGDYKTQILDQEDEVLQSFIGDFSSILESDPKTSGHSQAWLNTLLGYSAISDAFGRAQEI